MGEALAVALDGTLLLAGLLSDQRKRVIATPSGVVAGEIVVARLLTTTSLPAIIGPTARHGAKTLRRWQALLPQLPPDPADASLAVLDFCPDDVAEPLPEDCPRVERRWPLRDEDALLDALDANRIFDCLGQEFDGAWVYAWPGDPNAGHIDLGGWRADDLHIELARLIVDETEARLVSGDRRSLAEVAARVERLLGATQDLADAA